MPFGQSLAGGGAPVPTLATAQVSITHPVTPATVTVVGTGNKVLNPANGGFVPILNKFTEVFNDNVGVFTTLADGRVQMNAAGTLVITAYADVSHSVNNTHVGAVFAIERNAATILSPRSVHAKVPNTGDIGNISGVGSLSCEVGDIIGLDLASDTSGTVTISSSSLVFNFRST